MTLAIWVEGSSPAFAVGALRITEMRARERELGALDAGALVAEFARQKRMLAALRCPTELRRFELRLVVLPTNEAWGSGTIVPFLLVRVDAATSEEARGQVAAALRDLHALMHAMGDGYSLAYVSRHDELAYALEPFRVGSMAEIRRRVAALPGGGITWPRRSIGFDPPRPQPVQPVLRHHYRWVARNENLYDLYAMLLAQPAPVVVSVQLEPTALTDAERDALRTEVAEAERWVEWSEHQDTEDRNRTPKTLLAALAREKARRLEYLEDAAFRMRVRVASPLPLRAAVIESVAQCITAPVCDASGDDGLRLRGGAEWQLVPATGLAEGARALRTLDACGAAAATPPQSLSTLFDLDEVRGAFRLPIPDVEELRGVPTRFARFLNPPPGMPSQGALIGVSTDPGRAQEIRTLADDRRRHCYIVGQTGTGKSTLFLSMALADIRSGAGVCVIDPHGDLIEEILDRYPRERAEDLVLLDPSDAERPVGLNLLEASEPAEQPFLVQELVGIITRMFPPEMTGPIFERNVRNAFLTLMANQACPGTLLEVPRLFADKGYHKRYLPFVADPMVRMFWEHEFQALSDYHRSEVTGYLTSKFERFVADPLARNVVGQARSTLHIDEIMQQGKVLLVNLSKGAIGEINSALFGAVIVAKLQYAAMARVKQPQRDRRDFYLYVDEFQNFATPRFNTLLSEARKFGLSLVLTNQYLEQLRTRDADDVLSALLGNVGTLIAMRVGPEDAGVLERQLAPAFRASDLLALPNWHAYVTTMVGGQRVRPFSMRTVKDESPPDPRVACALRKLSRLKYGRDRTLVELEIAERWR